jgi:hypothetical protein
MFYLLPEEIVARTELTGFPRDPHKVLDDQKWREVYESDYFQLALSDVWAWLVWPHLGVRGGMEQFSGYDPFWQLAHAYTLWIRVFGWIGLAAESYFNLDPGDTLAYLSHEELDDIIGQMIDFYTRSTTFPLWREAVQEYRAHEDYDSRRSSVKLDFYRKWYHSRAKVKILDFIQADEPGYYPFEKIDSRLDVERFIAGLDEMNRSIVKLLLAGYTQAEIAQRLGFANHSGVCKRIKTIGAEFSEYMET